MGVFFYYFPEERKKRYSLSKLVEVAAHNMARVRLVWASIWRVMADHFTRVGCGKDKSMAHFAVNALKQLAYQFLDKKELGDFNFQKVFNEKRRILMQI
jgi:Sec7-like guanine-nucleotide exchange factor